MKELIYLDTAFLHSFIAQSQGGLPQSTQLERQEQVTETSQQSTGYASRSFTEMQGDTGSLSIPGLVKSPSGRLRVRIQPGKTSSDTFSLSELESGKEIISKQLHDNALEAFEEHLSSQNQLHDISDIDLEGKFIKISSSFKIIDFKYLRRILQTDTLMEFMYKKQDEELERLRNEVKQSEKQQRAIKQAALTQFENQFKKVKSQMKDNFVFMEKSIDYLNDILPTESFIIMEDTIAPLRGEFLRERANELMFKYGGASSSLQVTMLGKVTQEIKSTSMPDLKADPLFEFPQILTGALSPLGVIKKGDYIVSPVAIYFE